MWRVHYLFPKGGRQAMRDAASGCKAQLMGMGMNMSNLPRRKLLSVALLTGLGATTAVQAQSTVGTIYGTVSAGANTTVVLDSNSGVHREIGVDSGGRYTASQLPVGTYTVSLKREGAVVDSRKNIQLTVGGSTDVSFLAASAANAQDLGVVNVSAAALPAIDVTTVDSRTVITSEQLARLPLGRNAEAIAKLAPGVAQNTGNFVSATSGQQLVSFGGASATENAYYINGFNTTDPFNLAGGVTLPYGAIDQQEVYTGGYSAQYGRSDGGVINQVGKRGTNEWHFGAQVLWEPEFARANQANIYYNNGYPGLYLTPSKPVPASGTLDVPRADNHNWVTTVNVYAGGPLIKDKLYMFVAAEYERDQGYTVNPIGTGNAAQNQRYNNPRLYAKLDWNITDSNILEITGAEDHREGSGTYYAYDYVNRSRGAVTGPMDNTKQGGKLGIIKYTSYITDNLTIDALVGKLKTVNYDQPGFYDPNLILVNNAQLQNPAYTGGSPTGIANNQVGALQDPGQGNLLENFRFNVTYHWGDHTLVGGIDNQISRANSIGTQAPGPGYYWAFGQTNPNLSPAGGVPPTIGFANGAEGYYVSKNVSYHLSSVREVQRAQYLEDSWQVSDRWLVKLGVRSDQFQVYNPAGESFIKERKPQWAPRLGVSWDVNGDASFKVFANAGRYYLAMPLNPAAGAAAGYIETQQYYTYGGIDPATGNPTNLTQISGPVSANNSYGQPPDPRTVTAKGLSAENQDEYILGMTHTMGPQYIWGLKGTFRKLNNAIDDFCDVNRVTSAAEATGIDVASTNSCYLINPGRANTFTLIDSAGNARDITLSNKDLGFNGLKRRYYSLEGFMEHPFDGTWYGKIDYTFSRSYGNTEGENRSDLLQLAGSASEDWDNSYIMVGSNGRQNNDHTHVLKLYGFYQLNPAWQVSANLLVQSGQPRNCLGAYGPDFTDPVNYGNNYHFCNGQISPPGSHGSLPWIHPLDLGVTYRPGFGESKLAFSMNIFNVLNEQRATYNIANSTAGGNSTPNYNFWTPFLRETPRYARFAVNYDF
jgi:TonB-dependent receptor-like protein